MTKEQYEKQLPKKQHPNKKEVFSWFNEIEMSDSLKKIVKSNIEEILFKSLGIPKEFLLSEKTDNRNLYVKIDKK